MIGAGASAAAIIAAAGVLRNWFDAVSWARSDSTSQLAIAGTRVRGERRTLGRRPLERGAQNRLDICPAIGHQLRRSLVRRRVCP